MVIIEIFRLKYVIALLIGIALFGCETVNFINDRGKPYKQIAVIDNQIFPTDIDVSIDNDIYFAYNNKKGRAICSINLNTGFLKQITEDGNSDFSPVISHNGKKIIFKRGNIFGGNNKLYIIDSDGTNCNKLIDEDIYITKVIFSQNDSIIYFIGGALFNDTLEIEKSLEKCQDIFAIGVDGKNLRRITTNCITSWIYDIILIPNSKYLFISFETELNWWEKKSPSIDYTRIKEKYTVISNRKPYKNNFNGLVNVESGRMEEITIDVCQEYKSRSMKEVLDLNPLISKSAQHYKEPYVLFKTDKIYKFNYENNTLELIIDSINNVPISYGHYTDSVEMYNFKYVYGKEKLVGVVGEGIDLKLVLLDIESKKIEKELKIDTNNFIPSGNKTIFRNNYE
ncbi:MAG: hypothetical protein J5I47_10955 [Vicingus serpentipes]|nr:hypothetical protein [Vicingus serpentipes]